MTNISTLTLPCGLRAIVQHVASPVVYAGLIIQAGTRHEDAADSGMAHFIEHMSFKGTARRNVFHINALERRGGDLNAFTNKNETTYCATVLRRDFAHAVDLLVDMAFGSTYRQREIDREVGVICDEIDSYRDSPAELIFDQFESLLFADNGLGRDILGDAERLREYTTADARRFASRWYRPENAVLYVRGRIDAAYLRRVLERQPILAAAPAAAPRLETLERPVLRRDALRREEAKDTHQAHVLLGTQTYAGSDERRFALALLNNVLGGPGMNSRLNQSLRERRGLVYSVDASLSTYPDAGWWGAYFGCDPEDTERCLDLTHRELRRLIAEPLSPAQLRAAKTQLVGQMLIAAENAENAALALGRTFMHYGRIHDIRASIARIEALKTDELMAVAAEVYCPENLTTLIYR